MSKLFIKLVNDCQGHFNTQLLKERNKPIDRHTDTRLTDTLTRGRTDRQTHVHTVAQTHRHTTNRQTDAQTNRLAKI
jgi:hypothetical protein